MSFALFIATCVESNRVSSSGKNNFVFNPPRLWIKHVLFNCVVSAIIDCMSDEALV